ncbi:MAG: pyridoxal phosphate-dependent aminotransferase [Steroidobacteraceae bacterium]|nr:pyridoxal phosphate-dependent aminotransferase [Steroidobacteraceae bacterium]MDW8257920.1 pyridoxal phosphate-dependent aminotransferase [Gammaproteobacteria bacterium]
MTIALSRRVQRVKPSPTLAVTALAAKLRAEGKDIISLGAGEPDFDTPGFIEEAGVRAIREHFTRYTDVGGIAELKDAIIEKFRRDNGLHYERNQILVSTGAKQTIFNLCMAVLDPGDEVIIPSPYWVSYPDMVMLADGLPVTPDAGPNQGYKITPRQLEAAITPKTKLVLLNSPCNPTGAAFTRAELQALGEVLLKYPRILIGTDDMYEKIYWGSEPFCSLVTAVPDLYHRTVTINGHSKSYAMTGWRIGYCGGPKEVITAMTTIQGQSTSNPSSIAQKAAVAALRGDQSCVAEMNKAYKRRHDLVNEGLNSIPGISCVPGVGTFYAFADVSKAIARLGLRDDNAFAEYLLTHAQVAVVAGSGFGCPGHMRISFATSEELLIEALKRIRKAVSEPTGPVA